MAAQIKNPTPEKSYLKGGEYFGEILGSRSCCDLVLTELRHTQAKAFWSHSHELAFFSLLLDGAYTEYCGAAEIPYKQLNLVSHGSGLVHRDRIGPSGVRLFNIELKDSWIEKMRQHAHLDEPSVGQHSGELAWLGTKLYQEFRQEDTFATLAIEGLVLEMLAVLGRTSAVTDKRPPDWLNKVRHLLEAEFTTNVTLSHIADQVDVHPFYLSRVFRKFYRQTIAERIQELRVEFASKELLKPEAELATIAIAAGFADQSHFTRVFKQVTGGTPGAFRSAMLPDRKTPQVPKLPDLD